MEAPLRGRLGEGNSRITKPVFTLLASTNRGFTLFVANLPYDCNYEDTYRIFQWYGNVTDVYIPQFPNSPKLRGYAYVRFQYEDKGRAAMGVLDARRIDGRIVQVMVAKPRGNSSSSLPRSPPFAPNPCPVAPDPGPVPLNRSFAETLRNNIYKEPRMPSLPKTQLDIDNVTTIVDNGEVRLK
ncbi:serine/arginine-rich splicing factor SC35-like [Magnolia sinica]|uniref:serine/arginine-rich splicing factor SC35-like n=1 Tax=Magnolia sinica TaxID=86752 RepID=UPI002658B22B|nr:serine/arginine-rich splicing factor SC35-like [Magnolia sinica]